MRRAIAALACGAVFGLGLCVSQMVNPARVVGFLDVFGRWDATLAFVMAAAVTVTAISFPLIVRRARPILSEYWFLPQKTTIDRPLVAGSMLFGVGWGLAGLCPGPAIAGLATLSPSVVIFVASMVAGQWLVSRFE